MTGPSIKKLSAIMVVLSFFAIPQADANSTGKALSIKGTLGQVLTASSTSAKSGSLITVKGNRFDETVGIYLAFCVVPKKGEKPKPCGGGINKAGTGEASFWISSNPPPYALGLTKQFLPGGRFTEKVQVSQKIGKFDCKKVKCAITVRADHLRGEDRSFDMFIPVKIK
jgi:hypothetical protein